MVGLQNLLKPEALGASEPARGFERSGVETTVPSCTTLMVSLVGNCDQGASPGTGQINGLQQDRFINKGPDAVMDQDDVVRCCMVLQGMQPVQYRMLTFRATGNNIQYL